jgi:hypothetical protein
LARALGKFL